MSARKRRASKRGIFESVDHFDVVEGISVGGANQKDLLEDPESGQRYIAKLGRRNNDVEVMTEYAISLIGRSLGVTVADARIAQYRGRLRFLSRYFLTKRDELVHGMQLFEELYDQRTVKEVLGEPPREQAMFSVQSVKAAFAAHYLEYGAHIEDELFGGFVSMLTHDAFIGVQDRHRENWGVIVRREIPGPPPRFAPLYDSARGLFCNARDPELKRFTGRDGCSGSTVTWHEPARSSALMDCDRQEEGVPSHTTSFSPPYSAPTLRRGSEYSRSSTHTIGGVCVQI